VRLDWANIRVVTTRIYSDSIKFVVTWAKSNHIRLIDTTIATRDIKVADKRVNINTSLDDYIGVNRSITRTIINSEYNRKLVINRTNYCIDYRTVGKTSNFWITRLKNNIRFLNHKVRNNIRFWIIG